MPWAENPALYARRPLQTRPYQPSVNKMLAEAHEGMTVETEVGCRWARLGQNVSSAAEILKKIGASHTPVTIRGWRGMGNTLPWTNPSVAR